MRYASACLFLVACGQGHPGTRSDSTAGGSAAPPAIVPLADAMAPAGAPGAGAIPSANPSLGDATTSAIPTDVGASCLGFQVVGLKYSPGGNVLPNTCKPFDAITNNPYAIRCIDAIPAYKTPYPGDELCVLPPAPDKGTQIGAHPQGASYWDKMWAGDFSDYSNQALTKPYEVAAGAEVLQNFYTTTSNEQAQKYFRLDNRMREGSHHLTSWFPPQATQDGWAPLSDQSILTGPQFYNAQSPHTDRPNAMQIAPEDQGLGMSLSAHASMGFQLHHINPSASPILRENWINVWWLPDGATVTPVQAQDPTAWVNYPPNQVLDNSQTVTATGDTRIVSIFGHRHAWTTRFSATLTRMDGTTQDIYESFNWLEMPTFQLDSVTTNPTPQVATQVDGSISGILTLHAGDKITYTCYVDTTAAHAQKLGHPVPSTNLTIGNQAFGAEMCILNLETTGPMLSQRQGQPGH